MITLTLHICSVFKVPYILFSFTGSLLHLLTIYVARTYLISYHWQGDRRY